MKEYRLTYKDIYVQYEYTLRISRKHRHNFCNEECYTNLLNLLYDLWGFYDEDKIVEPRIWEILTVFEQGASPAWVAKALKSLHFYRYSKYGNFNYLVGEKFNFRLQVREVTEWTEPTNN